MLLIDRTEHMLSDEYISWAYWLTTFIIWWSCCETTQVKRSSKLVFQLQEPLEAKDSEQDLEQQEVEQPTAATSKRRSHQLSLELKDEEENLEDSLHLSRTRLPNILHRRQRGSKKKQEEEEAFSDMEDDYEYCAEFAE